ncbi:YcaO-like family protein [Streptomyces sp. NPDC005402]|uniref:YcaO-like family protein n=1 Tax=Streptomyces sp. NPDC005402 TaxID=3155338 RepID=UPI0033AFFFDF
MTDPTMAETGRGGTVRPAPGSGPAPSFATTTRVLAGVAGTPPALRLAVSDLPEAPDRPWQSSRRAFGTSWQDPAQARRAAEGEAAERHCEAHAPAPERLHFGSHSELTRRGLRALDPRRLILYSARQYATPGFPFRPFGPDSPAHWLEARSVTRGTPVLVPAFLVHSAWPHMPRPLPEPLYAFPAVGGVAAGPTEDFALTSGLEEAIERDAAAVWWANAHPSPALPADARLRRLSEGAGRAFDVRCTHLANDFGVPVLAAGVRSRDEGRLTYGFAVRADPLQAAAKALAEAYTLQITCQSLDSPSGIPHPAGRPSPFKPWRRDRRYLDAYRADGGDAVEQLCHLQLYLDRRAADRVAPWAWAPAAGTWDRVPTLPGRSADVLTARVADAGFEVLSVDLTTPDTAAIGLTVLRVMVPGLAGAAPAAYPPLGGRRLSGAAVRLGWRTRQLGEEELNTFPMPHS